MNRVQKFIVISTLVVLAVFLHVSFCEWETGGVGIAVSQSGGEVIDISQLQLQHRMRSYRYARRILSTGAGTGIHSRTPESYTTDALLGFALPIAMFAAVLVILTASNRPRP